MRMADVTRQHPCPTCDEPAERSYSAPMLARISSNARQALDAEEKNREQPPVVHSVPPGRRGAPAITRNPKHYKLPRP